MPATWKWTWFEGLIQDLRYGLRQLRRSPLFAALAIVTLALGIGANSAIFTLVRAVLLNSLPVANPSELYSLGDGQSAGDISGYTLNFSVFSYPLYKEVRDHTPEFSEVAGFEDRLVNLSIRRGGTTEIARTYNGELVSGNYFSTLGVRAAAGRGFTRDDDQANAPLVAVMSYRVWQQQYGLDPSVVGGTFSVNNHLMTVVGVSSPGFFGDTLRSDPPDFWLPLAAEPILNGATSRLNRSDMSWLYAIGRLRPGEPPARVESHVTAEVQRWLAEQKGVTDQIRADIAKVRVLITPAGAGIGHLRRAYSEGLRLLVVVSGLVLLIACANIANLLLARGAARHSQTAVRVALGAGRARLVRQMVTEGILLALVGGLAGIGVAFIGARAILLLAFRGATHVPIDPNPSAPILVFTLGLSLLAGVVFSAAPAWIGSKTSPVEALRGSGRSMTDRSALPQRLFVVLQAALSLVLLVGAGLLTQSLRHLENQHFGFETEGRIVVGVDPSLAGYSPERLESLYRQIQERLSQISGVRSVSFSFSSPMGSIYWVDPIGIEGRRPADPTNPDSAAHNHVSAHYFETIGTRLLRGRVIDERDTPTSAHVAVINQTFVRSYFRNEDPIGKHVNLGDVSLRGNYEIVGIVEDAKYVNPRAPVDPMMFLPLLQLADYRDAADVAYQNQENLIQSIQLRVAGHPADLELAVRRTLTDINPNLVVLNVMSFGDQVNLAFNRPRLVARLTALYGLLALVLAAIGLYGVASYMAAQRTREIGIRMALGAERAKVVTMMLRSAMAPIILGLMIGIVVALANGGLIASQLYGVKSYDPLVMLVAILVLLFSAVLAAIVPARRAASIDPTCALRME